MCQCKELKKQFRFVQFRLQYPNAADFAQSPWLGVLVVLIYRFAVAALCTGWVIGTFVYLPSNREKWFLYLTNWSFFFLALYFVCATMVTGIHYKKARNHSNRVRSHGNRIRNHGNQMRWYHEALWVIYNIAAVSAMLVTVAFWSMVIPALGWGVHPVALVAHGFNFLLIVGDTLLSCIPVRLFHVIYPMIYGVVYVVFTVIYWAGGGTGYNGQRWIYPQTDYTGQPVFATVSLLGLFFIGLPLFQSCFFGLYVLRVWLKKKCCK